MHYFLLGSSVMALIYLSAEGNTHVFQKPRFVGVKTGQTVKIYCVPSNLSLPAHVEWFKGQSYKDQLKNSQKITITEKSDKLNAAITIKKVEIEDRGTYFCKLNGMLGPGTELQVSSSLCTRISLSRVKDVIIFLQALLLILVLRYVLCLCAVQGLEIEQCGGADLYEDITALARETDAAWEVESPDQE
uniref:Ig-like domain-containing protein n=1 Tax=Sinocyclocheilus rhinocerous TaxID=307959 RepID=A0A673G0S5_9TELE